VQLIDFGLGKLQDVKDYTTVLIPNPRYFAPELLLPDDDRFHPTPKSDVYSFGMLMLRVSVFAPS
jgi:serine/threonine protein kinase